ncbi:MAG: 16S rRNA (guanine(527)-N(7))-methyltransferase RsmG [Pseudomonadota bacterium]
MTANRPDRIVAGAQALGVELDEAQIVLLRRYLDLLEKWNVAYNLTAVRSRKAMEVEHILDSLAVVPHIGAGPVLDVGSGGGLPGLVLAVARPQWQHLLIDSNGKKTRFLKQAVHDLGLRNVVVQQARIEAVQVAVPIATVVSRAFAALPDMAHSCRVLLDGGARLVAMKGVCPDDEIAALPADVMVAQVIRLVVPGLDKERHLVCIVRRHDEMAIP